jgi:hypothetical protein
LENSVATGYNWEQTKALAAIHEAGREIAASLDLERTLRLVMQKAAETLPMDAGVLFVRNEALQRYVVAVSHNIPPEQEESITFAFNEGVPGWTIQHRRPLIIEDARLDSRVHPKVVAAGVLSVLAVPLICREKIVGVLTLFCQGETHAFDAAALQLAQVFADQAAVFWKMPVWLGNCAAGRRSWKSALPSVHASLKKSRPRLFARKSWPLWGRLAASVAHEINNPLQAISLHLQLLTDETLSPGGEQRLDVVQQEFDRIAVIVERLLDFQRPQARQPQPVCVIQTLAYVVSLAGQQLQRSGVTLAQDLPEDLPDVLAEENQLKQVFLNLVLNAAEAMPGGGAVNHYSDTPGW